MEFRILGPLEVRDRNGGDVAIRGRQQPKVLATLLLENGHAVPLHRLVDALWDDDPPGTARRQVQNTVAALRRRLSSVGKDPIEPVGDGYRLRTEELDFVRFNNEVAQAHRHIDEGRQAQAHALLCGALDRWRGPALAGLSGRLITSAAMKLAEARLQAMETRMDVELTLGQPGRVTGDARELLAANPYRQKPAELLMVALHQSGRDAEALQVFEEFRLRLAEELGIDPGQSLRDRHRQILRSDSTVSSGRVSPPSAALPIPAQLPPDIGRFTGRSQQLEALDAVLDGGDGAAVLSTLTGTGGVGKTALALRWAHRRRDRFPDGQLFINLRGYDHGAPLSAHDALTRFLRALGQPPEAIPADAEEAAALYRTKLAGRRVLIVLDNAGEVGQVRPLLPASAGSLALVTSRDALAGLIAVDDAQPINLDLLSQHESLELLSDIAGAARLQADPASAHRIVELCGRLPLALRIAAANLASRPHSRLSEFAAELAGADRLSRLAVSGDARAAVADSITLTYQTLEPRVQEFFLTLGLICGTDFSDSLAAAVGGLDETESRLHIDRLISAHLLERHQEQRLRFHDLVRLYAAQGAQRDLPQVTGEAATDRLLTWYEGHTAGEEFNNLTLTIDELADHPRIWRAVEGIGLYLHGGEDPARIEHYGELGLRAATADGDQLGIALMHNVIARAIWSGGDLNLIIKHGEAALVAATASGDDVARARMLNNLSAFETSHGNMDRALSLQQECVRLEAKLLPPAERALGMINLAENYRLQCRFAEAEDWLSQAIRLAEGSSASAAHLTSAFLCADFDRGADALDHANQALEWARRVGQSLPEQQALMALGMAHRLRRQWDESESALLESLELARRNDRNARRIFIHCEFASLWYAAGSFARARTSAETALMEARRDENAPIEADAGLMLCRILVAMGDFAAAREYGEVAAANPSATPVPLFRARVMAALAAAHEGLGDMKAARECGGEAREIFARFDIPEARAAIQSLAGLELPASST